MKVMKVALLPVVAMVCCACAGGPAHADGSLRPADRPECRLAAANEPPAPGHTSSLDYARCHPGEHLEWSSGRDGTIKPEFSGKRDE